MNRLLDRFSRLVTARPYLAILILVAVTVALGAGITKRHAPAEGASLQFLPPGSPLVAVDAELKEFFGDSADINQVTLVFRGEAITPGGLAQMDTLINQILADTATLQQLAATNPIIVPSTLLTLAGGIRDFSSVTQAEIDRARGALPWIADALDTLTGSEDDGTPVAVGVIRLRDPGDDSLADVERRINDAAVASAGPLVVSSVSPVIVEDAYTEATTTGVRRLIGQALVLVAALILLFLRSLSDLLLTLSGLFLALVWIVGAEGWLGPGGLGWIGEASSLTVLVPIIIISLTVDYAIQTVSNYREQRNEGEPVLQAARTGLRNVAVPLTLAAVTTMASFLATLFSPISVVAGFGVVAALGVGLSLIVMLTLMPAGRTIIDSRREARGKLTAPRPVSSALPGVARMAQVLGKSVARRPAPYLIAVAGVTVGLGIAAFGLKSEFHIRDILPQNGSVYRDLDTLEAAVGGSTELGSILVRAEAAETRTLLNVRDLAAAFADEDRRPRAAAGPIEANYESLVRDWTHDSGKPGDKYDPELAALFREASAGVQLDAALMQEFLDRLGERDPSLERVLAIDPAGDDAILLQFAAFTDDPAATQILQDEIEARWAGDDQAITATGTSVLAVAIIDQITARQSEAISSTIAIALGILMLFYWVTLRKPVLAIIAVGPIILVLVWVLGMMAVLGIPYSLLTSIVTALSIGIGVDYTIHIIHRYREEFARLRDPQAAAITTLATTGSALLGSALTTAFGFGVLFFSPLQGFQQFGVIAALAIVFSLLVSTVVVPPALTVWGAYENMKLRSTVQRLWEDLDETVEGIYAKNTKAQKAEAEAAEADATD